MKIKILLLIIGTTCILTGCVNETKTSEIRVMIDASGGPAYTVYAAYGKTFDASSLDVEMIPLDEFEQGVNDYIGIKNLVNDYPDVDVQAGIVDLLKTYPETPFGYTFNGGIAFTYNDYQYAKELYDEYINDQENYTPLDDQAADPIHPLNHMGPLLELN